MYLLCALLSPYICYPPKCFFPLPSYLCSFSHAPFLRASVHCLRSLFRMSIPWLRIFVSGFCVSVHHLCVSSFCLNLLSPCICLLSSCVCSVLRVSLTSLLPFLASLHAPCLSVSAVCLHMAAVCLVLIVSVSPADEPESPPTISGHLPSYHLGDWLRVNCSSGPAMPAPELTWYINGEQAAPHLVRSFELPATEYLATSVLQLKSEVRGLLLVCGNYLRCLGLLLPCWDCIWRMGVVSCYGDSPWGAFIEVLDCL